MFTRFFTAPVLVLAVLATVSFSGCAGAKRDTTGFTMNNTATVPAGFEDTWQAVKHVLREGGYELYTRDKRGTFVAYSKERHHLLEPQRVKYTIDLSPLGEKETEVKIEAVKQVYGVTLLTRPDWHDRKLTEDKGLQEILDALQKKVAGPAAVTEATPAAGQ